MGRLIVEVGLVPDLVIVSGAARTRETYKIAASHWLDTPVICSDSTYEASATTIMAAIEACGGDKGHVMVIGHNPGLTVLLMYMINATTTQPSLSIFRQALWRVLVLMLKPSIKSIRSLVGCPVKYV